MRMFIGIILGSALTMGGLYIADSMSSGDPTRTMVQLGRRGKERQCRRRHRQGRLEKDCRLIAAISVNQIRFAHRRPLAACTIEAAQARTS